MHFPKLDEEAIFEELKRKTNTSEHKQKEGSNSVEITHILDTLDRIRNHADVGGNLPPMYRMKGIKRILAKFIGKITLRVSQIITRDQRVVNYSLVESVEQIANYLQIKDREINALTRKLNNTLEIIDEKIEESKYSQMELKQRDKKIVDLNSLIEKMNSSIKTLEKRDYLKVELMQRDKEIEYLKNETKNLRTGLFKEKESSNQNEDHLREYLKEQVKDIYNKVDSLLFEKDEFKLKLNMQESRLSVLLEEARSRLPESFNNEQLEVYSNVLADIHENIYVEFENVFRGSRKDIKNRLEVYLPLLQTADEFLKNNYILDLGCGRGEWLELLKEHGYTAKGIDLNKTMISVCNDLGLDAIQGDMFEYLSGLRESSIGMISGFHIIEHLTYENQLRFLGEIVRVLAPKGFVILETPNPKNLLVGSGTFYIDPTHTKPLYPETLMFLAEMKGLNKVETNYLNPRNDLFIQEETTLAKRLNELLYGPQDFSIVGWKA